MQDPWEKNEPGLGLGRDPSRTPFQWDALAACRLHERASPGSRSIPTGGTRNVATLRGEPASILCLYRRLIELRRRHRALNSGDFRLIAVEGDVLLYERASGETDSGRAQLRSCAEHAGARRRRNCRGRRAAVDATRPSGPMSALTLRGDEGVIVLLPRMPGSVGTRSRRDASSKIGALQQIIQAADAVPAIAVGLEAARVLAVVVCVAVIVGQEVDQQLAARRP